MFGKNISIISIVGVQSRGKPTIMNNLFSISFNTSQGKCSRCLYGSLIPIKDHANFDCVLIVDTERIETMDNENDNLLAKRLLLFV
jgi:hypothetical protein